MKYLFAAERKLIFFISAGGKNRLVEFSDRNRDGASQFSTNEMSVAKSIRKTSLYKRGVITQVSGPTEEEELAAQKLLEPKRPSIATVWQQASPAPRKRASKPANKPAPTVESVAVAQQPETKVMEFANITFAREAIAKELGIPKSKLRSQTAIEQAAREHGITIKYVTA